MIVRVIEVFSTLNDELICELELSQFWSIEKLKEIVVIDYDDSNIHLIYRLSKAQVIVLGGSELLELNNGNIECFLSYNQIKGSE